MDERKSYIKTYVKKAEIRDFKNQKLNSGQLDSGVIFDLNNEIESLNNEISNAKKIVLS